ncbi:DUF1311 domain-containing protein [Phreatobacter aquaticus]|uniref:DUF1311 domain-containing protein n=1 Tax=Phreatobacter aquaticus TaxID=2570229 RepID=A0A4D7QNB3_9HYPH|nr:lysozyme inhibitor LprI family protein [Phreatobacter aquaticus]QCK86996.1 DUF1311 domain-containing protein [Phreatobacter aquaticus]
MLKRFLLAAMTCLSGLVALPALAQTGPSFRCTPDLVGAEYVICANPSLHGLDRSVAAAYRAAGGRAQAVAGQSLRDSQRAWIETRNSCTMVTSRRSADIANCVRDAMNERIGELERWGR